jgi:hypothetical protein
MNTPRRWASTAGIVVLVASLFIGLFPFGAAIAGLLVWSSVYPRGSSRSYPDRTGIAAPLR